MKIGIFVDTYKPITTGVVHSVELWRQGLEALGHEIHIFAPASPGYQDREARVYRFHSVNLSRKVAAPLAIPISRQVLSVIPRLGLDVIHTQHPFSMGRLGVYFARKLALPVVYTFHTQYEQYAHYVPLPQPVVRTAARRLVADHAERCDLIICPTPSSRDLLLSYGVRRPIEILPNAIDLRAFDRVDPGDLRSRLGITPGERVLIYCGRLAKEKNIPFLLRALRHLLTQAPRTRLLIVGEGTEQDALEKLATELGLDDRVVFAGKVAYADVPRYYAAADLFVMTSVTEVMPLALLEAMASGLPIVALASQGFSDTVAPGVNGLLTEHDPAAYAGALRHLLADEAGRRRMGAQARESAQRYSLFETARRLAEIYEKARDIRLAVK
jgi:glycosyltransferase involved in cell wall biosynthesis